MRNIVLVLFLFQFCRIFAQHSPVDTLIVATVNSDVITTPELKLCEEKFKPSVILEYKTNYYLNYDENFWNNTSVDESPAHHLRKKALNEAIQIKIQQQLAREMGLVKDITYKAFLVNYRNENLRRKEDLLKHKVIYGPTQYTEENYYDYLFSNLVLKLKQELGKSKFNHSEAQLRIMYDNVKDSLYKLPDLLVVRKITISTEKKHAEKHLEKQKKIDNLIQTIQDLCSSDFHDSIEIVEPDWHIATEILTFDPTVYQVLEGEEQADILSLFKQVETGKFSTVSVLPDGCRLYQILQRKTMGYMSFNSVRNLIETRYLSTCYDKYIHFLRQNSIIVQY
jgi:hypothetical protein